MPGSAIPCPPGSPSSLDDARTRLEINLAIAEAALRLQRPRNAFTGGAVGECALSLIRVIRTGEDELAWAELEPLTTSGEILHLIGFARASAGEFSAQSLLACAERLWCTRLARGDAPPRRTQRRLDPA